MFASNQGGGLKGTLNRGGDAYPLSCRMSRSLPDIQRGERKSRKRHGPVKTCMSKPEESEEVEVSRCVWSVECKRVWSERRKGPHEPG